MEWVKTGNGMLVIGKMIKTSVKSSNISHFSEFSFLKALDTITTEIRKNFLSTTFGKSMMRERFIHLVTSF